MNNLRENVANNAPSSPVIQVKNDAINQQTSALTNVTSAESGIIRPFLSDAMYSGLATWTGTIISIIMACVAYKQARAAISAANSVKREQKRKYIENAQRTIADLDHVARPIALNGLPDRGVKISAIASEACALCHKLLSAPIDNILPDTTKSIKNIESYFSKISSAISAAKENPEMLDHLIDLQQNIRTEIQFLSRTCLDYLDRDAIPAD